MTPHGRWAAILLRHVSTTVAPPAAPRRRCDAGPAEAEGEGEEHAEAEAEEDTGAEAEAEGGAEAEAEEEEETEAEAEAEAELSLSSERASERAVASRAAQSIDRDVIATGAPRAAVSERPSVMVVGMVTPWTCHGHITRHAMSCHGHRPQRAESYVM